ncbi:MAG TPA: ABC-2 transporter permease [Tissierellaceae bacterium]
MIALIKKDFKLNFAVKSSLISMVMFVPLLLFITEINDIVRIFHFIVLSYGYILINIPFKYDVKDKSHLLIQSMPVRKRDIVISKYIFAIISYCIALAFSLLIFTALDLLNIGDSINLSFNDIKETFLAYILISSINLPTQFRLPPKLANIVNVFIYVFITNLFVFIPNSTTIANFLTNTIANNDFLVLIVSMIIYLVSMIISIYLYKTRDLY